MTTRVEIITAARSMVGRPYQAQGRGTVAVPGFDCAGVMIKTGHLTNVTAFDILGYSSEPDGETFERLLDESDALVKLESFWGAQVADILACDFGKGVQHVAIVSSILEHRRDWRRFTVIHATRAHGVNEAPLPMLYYKALKSAYQIKGIVD